MKIENKFIQNETNNQNSGTKKTNAVGMSMKLLQHQMLALH